MLSVVLCCGCDRTKTPAWIGEQRTRELSKFYAKGRGGLLCFVLFACLICLFVCLVVCLFVCLFVCMFLACQPWYMLCFVVLGEEYIYIYNTHHVAYIHIQTLEFMYIYIHTYREI